jgi:hypothetical protein
VRTLGHENVTVFAGDIAELPEQEPFDVVALIGVLEYSTAASGGGRGPMALLEASRSLLRADGILVVAIENQVGLKYLLGYPEDHLGIPWVGLEGYGDGDRPRTWSQAVLRQMFTEVGLTDQEWLYPYPDYKQPTFIARDRLFASDSGRQVLRQFLRNPVVDHAGSPDLVCDGQQAFNVMLDAGIGPETANSFLVVASAVCGRAGDFVGNAEAWLSSGERLQRFRSQRVITMGDEGYRLSTTSGPTKDAPAQSHWLVNKGHAHQLIRIGECFDDRLIQAIRADDMDSLIAGLTLFDSYLEANRCERALGSTHPFISNDTKNTLPGEFLDCTFKNLVLDAQDSLHFIDREWTVHGGIDEELIQVRAYTELALRIAVTGMRSRWNPLMTIGDLVQSIRRLVGDGWTADVILRYASAEDELQQLVSGQQPAASVEELLKTKLTNFIPSFSTLSLIRRVEGADETLGHLRTLRDEHHELQLAHHELQLAHHELQLAHHELQLAHHDTELRRRAAESQLAVVAWEHDRHRILLDGADDARQSLQNEVDALRRSRSYKLGQFLTAPLRFLR